LYNALHDVGVALNNIDPDYVIIGETSNYNYDSICKAVTLVNNGAKLIGTNTDLYAPIEHGMVPACRALVAPIEMTTGKLAYYVGKPNPLMMRTGLQILGVHSQDAVMIGDRMDTDIIAGIETGLDTVLVLSGVTNCENINDYPYCPKHILKGVGYIVPGYSD
jgi:NagD protein